MAEWTAAYVNELPDSAFLLISSGGDKDAEHKTTPRSLRHFPYRDKDGAIDLPHLRNAIGRIPQADIPAAKKEELQAHATSLLSQHNDSRQLPRVERLDLSSGTVGERRRTPQGGLVADANLTRTGIFDYRDGAGHTTRELRDPDEVFAPKSLETYPLAPVTVDHPGRVGPDNWKQHAVGTVGPNVRRNGEFVAGEVHVQHGDAMDRAETGDLSEVSCGYSCDLDPTPGLYQGKPYDAVQRNIRINHVALGPKGWGRMGPDVRLHMDASAAVSGLDAASYVRADDKAPQENSGMDPKDLEKLQADLKSAKDAEAAARADAATAKTESDKTLARLREAEAVAATLRAENELLKAQGDRARNDGKTAEEKRAAEADQHKRVEEMIQLRSDARMVFATADNPEGKAWKADGKGPDAIRREILASIAPTVKFDAIDALPEAAKSASLAHVYGIAIAHKREVDAANAKVRQVAEGARLDAAGAGGGSGDDDEEPCADKARKDMVKRKKDAWKIPRKDRGKARAAAT